MTNLNPNAKGFEEVKSLETTLQILNNGKPGISARELGYAPVDEFKQIPPENHRAILAKLLERIEKVNFRELAELEGEASRDQNLKQKHYVVCTIDYILKVAKDNDWGICRNNDFIYLYNGAYWSLVSDEEFKDFLGEAAQKMGVNKFDARFHKFRDDLYKQFLAVANLSRPNRSNDVIVINLLNGTYEITSNASRLRVFKREDFLTYQLPFIYDRSEGAKLFHQYLDRVLPDNDRQKVLAEFLGYIFTQNIKLEKCLLLYGTGANGKSVFFDIINSLLGKENISNCSLSDLNKEYNRAMLGNKLLNYGSEIKGNAQSDIFKQVVSGEPIQACRKYRDPFIMTNYAKLCFNCNELPRDVEHSEAYFRRFLIIPFDVTIPEDERNPQLAQEIIKSELSGVFNWVLEGLSRLLTQGNFSKCEAIKQQIVNYKTQSDSVYLFLEDEGYEKSDSKWCLLKEMYPEYKSFCMNDGYRPVSKSNFKKRLESFGYLIERRNVGWAVYAAK